jgi:hypothetical protein
MYNNMRRERRETFINSIAPTRSQGRSLVFNNASIKQVGTDMTTHEIFNEESECQKHKSFIATRLKLCSGPIATLIEVKLLLHEC